MPDHKEIDLLLAVYPDCSPEEKQLVERHLERCTTCQETLAVYREQDQALIAYVTQKRQELDDAFVEEGLAELAALLSAQPDRPAWLDYRLYQARQLAHPALQSLVALALMLLVALALRSLLYGPVPEFLRDILPFQPTPTVAPTPPAAPTPTVMPTPSVSEAIQAALDAEVAALTPNRGFALADVLDPETSPTWRNVIAGEARSHYLTTVRPGDPPTLPLHLVETVVQEGDLALVTVAWERGPSGTTIHQGRVYRRTAEGWRRTEPVPALWGEERQVETPHYAVGYRALDETFAQQIARELESGHQLLLDLLHRVPGRPRNQMLDQPGLRTRVDLLPQEQVSPISSLQAAYPSPHLASRPGVEPSIEPIVTSLMQLQVLAAYPMEHDRPIDMDRLYHLGVVHWLVSRMVPYAMPLDSDPDLVRAYLNAEAPVSLADVVGGTDHVGHPGDALAWGLLEYIAGQYSEEAALSLFAHSLSATDPLPLLAPGVLGVEADAFEAAWNRWLADTY